jgi:hypothetical protein
MRMSGDVEAFRRLAAIRAVDLDSDKGPAINAALNSWRVGYNQNALSLIGGLLKNPRASQKLCLFDFNHRHNHNPVNPSTYIEVEIAGAA